jgi:peptidyl-prolyl cis-trans isomerase C
MIDSKGKRRWMLGAAGVGVAGVVVWSAVSVFEGSGKHPGASLVGQAVAAGKPGPADAVLANINGQAITELEVAGLLQSGIDRAIVVDRYINKVVAAERGREMYASQAKAALRAAEREVLSTLYTTKRMEELRNAVTDAQVAEFYTQNVLDQNFQQWKVSYYLSASQEDANKMLSRLRKGDKEALEQLKPLVDQGDGYAAAQAIPYGLGRVVSKMKKGEFSEVLALRNGLLVLRIDDMKQLKKPTQEELKQEIIQALALEQFNKELEQARRLAKVELG